MSQSMREDDIGKSKACGLACTMLKYERIFTPLARSQTMALPSCPAEKSTLGSKGCGSSTKTSSSCPWEKSHHSVSAE